MVGRNNLTWVLAVLAVSVSAHADMIVTLDPKDANGNPPAGAVASGSRLFVDIFLSVDGDDNPLSDLRGLQFDFGASDETIERVEFIWHVDLTARIVEGGVRSSCGPFGINPCYRMWTIAGQSLASYLPLCQPISVSVDSRTRLPGLFRR